MKDEMLYHTNLQRYLSYNTYIIQICMIRFVYTQHEQQIKP